MKANPSSLGYIMPGEWEHHVGTWLTWPQNQETWHGKYLEQAENVYLEIIRNLSPGERVFILVDDLDTQSRVTNLFSKKKLSLENIDFFIIPTDDAWIRDYGPNFLINNKDPKNRVAANNWKFDSWGKKYKWELDNEVSELILNCLGYPIFDPGIVLEGGAIEVNGKGVCITTEQCLLNQNRNNGLSKEEMESYLKNYLGVKKIIWCQGDLIGDDTDGHIDNLVRFINPNTLVCVVEEDPNDPNYHCTHANYKMLKNAEDLNGNPFNIIPFPMPGIVKENENRLPASYANFYIGNQVVLLPTYSHKNDSKAQSILENCFPDRQVVPIPSKPLLIGFGSIHCLTQQQPS